MTASPNAHELKAFQNGNHWRTDRRPRRHVVYGHIEEHAPTVFEHACPDGATGLISKATGRAAPKRNVKKLARVEKSTQRGCASEVSHACAWRSRGRALSEMQFRISPDYPPSNLPCVLSPYSFSLHFRPVWSHNCHGYSKLLNRWGAAGFMTSPASATTMDGKPPGRNAAKYGPPKNNIPSSKPPAKIKQPPAQ